MNRVQVVQFKSMTNAPYKMTWKATMEHFCTFVYPSYSCHCHTPSSYFRASSMLMAFLFQNGSGDILFVFCERKGENLPPHVSLCFIVGGREVRCWSFFSWKLVSFSFVVVSFPQRATGKGHVLSVPCYRQPQWINGGSDMQLDRKTFSSTE